MEYKLKHIHCLNCNNPFPEGLEQTQEFFCPNCGQSSKESKLSFIRLIKDAISNILNLDSRLIHTFRDIFYPSKLTRFYIEGKRKYYVNPVRLFIFILIGLITLSLYSITLENSAMGVDQIYSKAERSKMLDEYTALMDTLDIKGHEPLADTLKLKLFNKVRSLQNDTLGKNGPDLFKFVKPVKSYGISTYDGIHLSQKALFEKYKVEGFWNKISVGQYIRIVTNPAGGIKYVIGNLTWAIFITVLLMSFIMKLLYIRNSYFLVEHLVLILNAHSLLFLIIAMNIILLVHVPLGDNHETIKGLALSTSFISILAIQFMSLKRYYKQGIFKTFIKQFIINATYTFIFNMVVLMVAIISLILY